MANSPKDTEEHLKTTVSVWRSLRLNKKFLGLTVDEFDAELKPCFNARDAVSEAEAKLAAAIKTRDDADIVGLALAARFVSAVKSDATEGVNSELLDAIGYVIPSKRKSGLHRKSNTVALPKAA